MPACRPPTGAELSAVARAFNDGTRDLAPKGVDLAGRGFTRDNLAIVLPYYVVDAFPFKGSRAAAREMAVGNAFGAAHFLAQDGWLDGEARPDPAACRLSDRCLARFVRLYGELVPARSRFWERLDRYFDEYFESVRWERDLLWSSEGGEALAPRVLRETLRRLGRKMSPLKATLAAGLALAGREDLLERAEGIVEEFHAGYQLVDDLEDFVADAAAGRRSVVWWLASGADGAGIDPATPPRELQAHVVDSGALEAVAVLVSGSYTRARDLACALSMDGLGGFLDAVLRSTTDALGAASRRGRVEAASRRGAAAAADPLACGRRIARAFERGSSPPPHLFSVGATRLLFDPATGLCFEVDHVAAEALDWASAGASRSALDVLRLDLGGEVGQALGEIEAALASERGPAAPWPPDPTPSPASPGLASLALILTEECNLECDYCYLRSGRVPAQMPEETALAALDLLLDESLGERDPSIVFFGGEPLLGIETIRAIIAAVPARAGAGRRVGFHMTTNGTLLSPEIASELAAAGVGVLVSIDGPPDVHDRHRRSPHGSSHAVIAGNLRSLPEGVRVGARATVSPGCGPLPGIVAHLKDLGVSRVHLAPVSGVALDREFGRLVERGFEELAREELGALRAGGSACVGNLGEALVAVATGSRRTLPCGAGSRYLCVGADGVLYLCHRFAGDHAYAVGDVRAGVDREAVARIVGRLLSLAGPCATCWARPLCGGPCYHDLHSEGERAVGPESPRCSITKRIFELALWMVASLPEPARRRLVDRALERSRPESRVPERCGLGAPHASGGGGDRSPGLGEERR